MEKKPGEERPLSWEHPSCQHWIASLSQILLMLALLSYVFLAGSFYDDIIHFSSYRVGITKVEAVALGLSVLLSVVLCIVSGTAYACARASQWRDGRKLAMWGLLVGGIGVLLVVGVLAITFLVEQSELAPALGPTPIPSHLWWEYTSSWITLQSICYNQNHSFSFPG